MISSFFILFLSLSLISAQPNTEPTLQVIPTNIVHDDPTLPSRIHSNIVNVGICDTYTMNPRQWAEALFSVNPITIPATDTPIQLDLIPIHSTIIEPTAPIGTTAPVAPPTVSTSPPLRLYASVPPLSITSSPACPIMPFTNQIKLSSSTSHGNIYTIYFVPSLPITHVCALSVTGHIPSSIADFTHTRVMEYDTTHLLYNVTLATPVAPAYPVRDGYSVYKVDMKTTETLPVKKAEVHLSHDVELNDLMSVVPLEFTSSHEFHHVLSSVPLKKDDALYLFFTIEKENGEICDSVLSMVSVE